MVLIPRKFLSLGDRRASVDRFAHADFIGKQILYFNKLFIVKFERVIDISFMHKL